jgi:hypothetical protein
MISNGVERMSTRELLDRCVIRVRRDLHRIQDLATVVGVNEPTPPEVTQALETLEAWTRRLVGAGRRRLPMRRP